jgi:hypothetical protein
MLINRLVFYLRICLKVILYSSKILTINLFLYFTGNGKDNLLLEYSLDCHRREAMNNWKLFFAPGIGDNIMLPLVLFKVAMLEYYYHVRNVN